MRNVAFLAVGMALLLLQANVFRSRSAVTRFLTVSLAMLTSSTVTRPGLSISPGSIPRMFGRSNAPERSSHSSLVDRPR